MKIRSRIWIRRSSRKRCRNTSPWKKACSCCPRWTEQNRERDYCILTLFLNCGLRISELVRARTPRTFRTTRCACSVKETRCASSTSTTRVKEALNGYLAVRRPIVGRDQNALFLSSRNERVSRSTVHALVKKHLSEAGLDVDAVFRAQAAPYSGDADAAKRRGRHRPCRRFWAMSTSTQRRSTRISTTRRCVLLQRQIPCHA